MSEELDVLKEVARRLERAGIAYMITGSIAANFYTVPRMTRDIDIVVELGERDVARFISLFETDYYLDAQTVAQAVRAKGQPLPSRGICQEEKGIPRGSASLLCGGGGSDPVKTCLG
jgi:hypothetical protein